MPKKIVLLVLGGLIVSLGAVLLYSTTSEKDEGVLMKIAAIKGNPATAEMVVILQETAGRRILPISIGQDQALAIHLGHQKIPSPRPLTHDLMAEMMKAAHLKVERVVITKLQEGTYYSQVRLQEGDKTHVLDARPSDAIALSLRVNAAIYAMPELLQETLDYFGDEEQTRRTEITAWGFAVQALTPELAKYFGAQEGVLVADVSASGPAAESGLSAGDLILRVDDVPVMSVQQFVDQIAAHASRNNLPLEIARGSERRNLLVTRAK
jgi:bifunctional DNase/RNase